MSETEVTNPTAASPKGLINLLDEHLKVAQVHLSNTKSRVALWRAALYMMDHPEVYWDDVMDVIEVAMAQYPGPDDEQMRQDFEDYFGKHSVIAAQPKLEQSDYRTFGESPMANIEARAKALAADAQGTFQGPLAPIAYELRAMITAAVTNNPEALQYHEGHMKDFVLRYCKQIPTNYKAFGATVHKLYDEVLEAQRDADVNDAIGVIHQYI